MAPPTRVRPNGSAPVRAVMIGLGTLALVLGVIGLFLPLVPTTPFLLVAAACYARGSRRLHHWLVNHKRLGPFLHAWWDHRAVPLYAKVSGIALIWISVGTSATFVVNDWWLRGVLLGIGLAVTIFLLTLRTARRETGEKNVGRPQPRGSSDHNPHTR